VFEIYSKCWFLLMLFFLHHLLLLWDAVMQLTTCHTLTLESLFISIFG
jgi:hypothetical protein